MKIKGRVYHGASTAENHEALLETLKLLMEAVFIAPGSSDDVDVMEGIEGNAIEISEVKLKCCVNPLGDLTCITLTRVDIERDVSEALQKSLEQLLGGEFQFITNPSNDALLTDDDYQLRLDAVVMS